MTDNIVQVPVSQLCVSETNARKDSESGQEDADIAGLAQSIREHGLLNPLTVRALPSGGYEILAGQRRYLACLKLGMSEVPAMVRKVSDSKAVALSLIENVQRADMHPIDKAHAFASIRDHYHGDMQRVVDETGVTKATIRRYLDLLSLPPDLQEELGTGHGSAGVGAMANIAKNFDDPDDMREAWNQIGGFTQDIQSEILKRSGGDIENIPDLVMQASEGAFDIHACGTGVGDCPHIPEADCLV
ncbi:MAG: ParB/RepB/Spo0J family partition protein, partial [Gammaproteobacteria bacterium]|nr:ParB/RepB/Spo0J family partition protein [Gammaproteobacteria bacterium]